MRDIKLDKFEICVIKERRSKLEFALVAPASLSDVTPEGMSRKQQEIARKIVAYIDFNLAIKPNNGVVLFQIHALAETGSPLFTLQGGQKLYHIPLSLYPELDEIVEESIFIVPLDLLTRIVEKGNMYKSIYECLTEEHNQNGLTVISIYGEDSAGETQEA